MPTDSDRSIDERARALIEHENTLVLATSADDGIPIATPLFYYPDAEGSLYWLSSPDSRHSRNLNVRDRVAVAIFVPATDWTEIRGVQMEGTAGAVEDPILRASVLVKYRQRLRLPPALDEAIAKSTLYVFRPAWWRFVDSLQPQAGQ